MNKKQAKMLIGRLAYLKRDFEHKFDHKQAVADIGQKYQVVTNYDLDCYEVGRLLIREARRVLKGGKK